MSLEQKRQHWLDADDNEVYASELRTSAAVYIAALEAENKRLATFIENKETTFDLMEELAAHRADKEAMRGTITHQTNIVTRLHEKLDALKAVHKAEYESFLAERQRAEQAEADLADCAKTRGGLKDALDAAKDEIMRLNDICDRLAAAGHRGDE